MKKDAAYWEEQAKEAFAARDAAKASLKEAVSLPSIPTDRVQMIKWLRYFSETEPRIACVLDFLSCPEWYRMKAEFTGVKNIPDINTIFGKIARETFLFGQCSIDNASLGTERIFRILNPEFAVVESATIKTLKRSSHPYDIYGQSFFAPYMKTYVYKEALQRAKKAISCCLENCPIEDKKLLAMFNSELEQIDTSFKYPGSVMGEVIFFEILSMRIKIKVWAEAQIGISLEFQVKDDEIRAKVQELCKEIK